MKTRRVGPSGWAVYLRKSGEFSRSMEDAQSRGDWNAVGLAAVHAVISAADALTSFHRGERSASQDHGDSVELIRDLPVARAREKADQALQVLDVKNLVEYEDRDFGEKESRAVAKKAQRFMQWVQENLPGIG